MTKLVHKTGDVFSTHSRGIGHGVNVVGLMGHGIALQFRNRFPEMHNQYKVLCNNGSLRPGETMIWEMPFENPQPDHRLFVYNIASQDAPGANAKMEWLITGVANALSHAAEHGLESIALPRIGSGIGGLKQDEVEAALTKLAEESPVDIELWTL